MLMCVYECACVGVCNHSPVNTALYNKIFIRTIHFYTLT